MAENAQPDKSSEKSSEVTSQGLSQFIAKVLEQLKLSSWLPAAMLVGCSALIVQLHNQRNLNAGEALVGLTNKPIGILVVLTFSLVLAAVVCQAFSFGAIKALEGYWGRTGLGGLLFALGVRLQDRKRKSAIRREWCQRRRAFAHAREQMLAIPDIPRGVIDVLEDEEYGRPHGKEYPEEEIKTAEVSGWRRYSSPGLLGRMEGLVKSIEEFPERHRMLPTKLGNVLRAYEDSLKGDDGDVEGLILRKSDAVGDRHRIMHDQHRGRLEMYCTLVLVYDFLAVFAVSLLTQSVGSKPSVFGIAAILVMLSVLSYYAAVAAARAYGGTLKAIINE